MTVYYPPWGFYYKVEFERQQRAATMRASKPCRASSVEYDTEEYKEGGENRFTHKLPVRTKYTDLVLKRGMLTGFRRRSHGSSTHSASATSRPGRQRDPDEREERAVAHLERRPCRPEEVDRQRPQRQRELASSSRRSS